MNGAARHVTVLAPERESLSALSVLPASPTFKIVQDTKLQNLKRLTNLFVAVSSTALGEVADIVKASNETKLLRALFIREDVPAEWLPQMLARADLRLARNVVVHSQSDWVTPRRIIKAWQMGGQNDLIARANVAGDKLLVMSCALQSFELSFDDLAPLRKIAKSQRANFRISESGSYIHWESGDIHLDIDAIRYTLDEDWRRKCDLEQITHDKKFGQAVASVRNVHKLGQSDIEGVSDRQLRRIENEGARPSVATLSALAKAHKTDLNKYLEQLASYL